MKTLNPLNAVKRWLAEFAPSRTYYVCWDMDGCLFRFIYGGDIFKKFYFETLPANKSLVEAAAVIDGTMIGNVKLKSIVLSSYLTNSPNDCRLEKNNALDRETSFPAEQRMFIPCGNSKWEAVKKAGIADRSILIDDYGENLKDWNGPYVKVSRDNEDMKEESKRHDFCISPECTTEEIVRTVLLAITPNIS